MFYVLGGFAPYGTVFAGKELTREILPQAASPSGLHAKHRQGHLGLFVMGTVQSLYLYQLAKDKTPDGRKTFANEISGVFLDNYPSLQKRERALMYEILEHLVHDVEMSLRKTVSEQLSEAEGVPRELAKILANDEIQVAFPILSASEALFDEDLIEIIHNRTVEHQFAITKRPRIGEVVTDALVDAGEESVIRSLLLNPNAEISSKTMSYLVEESKRVSSFQEPIVRREDVDPAVVKKMFTWVSSAVRQYVMDNYELDPKFVDQVLENAVLQEFNAPVGRPGASVELTEQLAEEGELTPDLIVLAIQNREARLFVTMFKRYTGIPEKVIMEMMSDYDGTGLAIACKSAELGKAVFSSIYVCLRKTRPGGSHGIRTEVRKLTSFYERISPAAAEKVVAAWQGGGGYKQAIEDLEL